MWPLWRAIGEKKNVGRNRDFRGFVNSFFLDLVSFTFTKLGKNSRLFFNY